MTNVYCNVCAQDQGERESELKSATPPTPISLDFPQEEYDERLERVRKAMKKKGIDVTLVTDPHDFDWLTGSRADYSSAESPSWLIITQSHCVGVVRYLEASAHRAASAISEWIEYFDKGPSGIFSPVHCLNEKLNEFNKQKARIGINKRTLSVDNHEMLQENLPQSKLIDFRTEQVRIHNSPREIEAMRTAAKANQDALMETIEAMEIGWSEYDILKHISKLHKQHLGDL